MITPSSPVPSLRQSTGIETKKDSALEGLPPEILERIFYPPKPKSDTIKVLHQQLPTVSTRINENFRRATNYQINSGNICLQDVGCKTAKEAVQYIFDLRLTSVDLPRYKDVDNEDLEKLRSCPELKSLKLSRGKFTEDQLVQTLEKMTNLQDLSLTYCVQIKDGDKFAEALGKLTPLKSLRLMGCPLSGGDNFARALEKLVNLKSLHLGDIPISGGDNFARALGKLKSLNELAIYKCTNISLGDSFWNLIHLKSLDLTEQLFSVEGLGKLTHLKHLYIHGCTSIPADLLAKELEKIRFLEKLNLKLCTQISGEQLITLTKSNPHLMDLTLGFLDQISGEQFVEALAHSPKLKTLELIYCPTLTGDQMVAIAKSHPKLQNLIISRCVSIDQAREILTVLPLKMLCLDLDITQAQKNELTAQFPKTQILFY